MVADDLLARRPPIQRTRLDRREPRPGAALAERPPRQRLDPLGGQDRPHRLRRHGCARRLQCRGDLGHGAVLGAQREHPVADPGCLAGPLRARLAVAEERRPSGAQLRGHLVHHSRRVAEPRAHLGRAGTLDEVRTERLVAPLRRLRGLHEVLRTRPHISGDLREHDTAIVALLPDRAGVRAARRTPNRFEYKRSRLKLAHL